MFQATVARSRVSANVHELRLCRGYNHDKFLFSKVGVSPTALSLRSASRVAAGSGRNPYREKDAYYTRTYIRFDPRLTVNARGLIHRRFFACASAESASLSAKALSA
jgi:hypothetical protein